MKILLVDDEKEFVRILTTAFEVYRPGYSLLAAYTGEEGLAKFEQDSPDLVLLDVVLPDLDGFRICQRIRAKSDVPIILLTARDREEDVVKGLEAGADDYITKPFSHKELMARIDALLRRMKAVVANGQPTVFRTGDLVIDFGQRCAEVRGRRIDLTPKEYEVLELLARNAGQVVGHDTLLARVWGAQYRGEPQYVKTYVHRLRKKIEENPHRPRYIVSHYGTGYRLERKSSQEEAARGREAHLAILPNSSRV